MASRFHFSAAILVFLLLLDHVAGDVIFSCDALKVSVDVESGILSQNDTAVSSNDDVTDAHRDVKVDEEFGTLRNDATKEEKNIDEVIAFVHPSHNGKRNMAYPEEGVLVLKIKFEASLECDYTNVTDLGEILDMTSQLEKLFGTVEAVGPSPERQGKMEYTARWNKTEFKMASMDLRDVTSGSGISPLPFYLVLFGGNSVKELDATFAYLRYDLDFNFGDPEGQGHVPISFATTRWSYKLRAPFISDWMDYRLSLIGHKCACNKTMLHEEKALCIECVNNRKKGVRLEKGTEILLHIFPNYVPEHLFRIILGYRNVFAWSPSSVKILSWLGNNTTGILSTYALLIFFCQAVSLKNVGNTSLRKMVSTLSILGYMALFCPCMLLLLDAQEATALVYIFYLDTITWSGIVYWLLCVAWLLYPGVVCLLGLIPAVFFASDIKAYGHFHCFLRPKTCPKSCPKYKTENLSIQSGDIVDVNFNSQNIEKIQWKIPSFHPERKLPLEDPKNPTPQKIVLDEENSVVSPIKNDPPLTNCSQILGEVFGLGHCMVYMLSIQSLYFVVVGLFPLYNFIAIASCFTAIETYIHKDELFNKR